MKPLLLLLVVAVVAFAVVNFTPENIKSGIFGGTGIGTFFGKTIPGFLREKLSIPESPVEKRSKILNELSKSLTVAREELLRAVPVPTDGIVPALPSNDDIRAHAKKAEEALQRSDQHLKDLTEANTEVSAFRTATLRAVDSIFPAATSSVCIVK